MIEDSDLLLQWEARADEAAFTALVQRYAGLVHGVAIRQVGGSHALAQEVGQNVFAMLARKAGSLASHPSLGGWLHRATLLEATHLLRREIAHSRKLAAFAAHAATMNADADAAPEHPIAGIDQALNRLPDAERTLLFQRFFQGRNYREMAQLSGENEPAIRKRVERALAKLAGHLSKSGTAATAMSAATSLQASLSHVAPPGYAAAIGASAVSPASVLPTAHFLVRNGALMLNLQKSITIAAVLLAVLLCVGGSYSLGRMQARAKEADGDILNGKEAPSADSAQHPGKAGGEASSISSLTAAARPNVREMLTAVGRQLNYEVDHNAYGYRAELAEQVCTFGVGDIPEALAFLPEYRRGLKSNESLTFEAVAGFIFAFWAKSDLAEARKSLTSETCLRPDGKISAHALRMVMGAWGETDPKAALQWALSLVDEGITPLQHQRGVGPDLFREWYKRDEEGAWREMVRRAAGQPQLLSDALRDFIRLDDQCRASFCARLADGADSTVRNEAIMLLRNHLRWQKIPERKPVLDQLTLNPALQREVLAGL